MKKILVIVLLLVCVFLLSKYDYYNSPYERWYKDGLGRLIPNPYDVIGLVSKPGEWRHNGSNSFREDVYGISDDDFEKYVDAVMECGFRRDFYRSDDWFHAMNVNPLSRHRVTITSFDDDSDPHLVKRICIKISQI